MLASEHDETNECDTHGGHAVETESSINLGTVEGSHQSLQDILTSNMVRVDNNKCQLKKDMTAKEVCGGTWTYRRRYKGGSKLVINLDRFTQVYRKPGDAGGPLRPHSAEVEIPDVVRLPIHGSQELAMYWLTAVVIHRVRSLSYN